MSRPLERVTAVFPRPIVNFVKQQVGRAVSGHLDALATVWFTDKGPRHHGYTAHYSRHLKRRRRSVETVLEIGIGGYGRRRYGGHSLYMWRSFFPHATIYGLDIHEKQLESTHRITVLQADQSDREALRRAVQACPSFDLVVDDGSHMGPDVVASFEVLFPLLNAGGIYAIEDVFYAYEPAFGGAPWTPGTTMALVKDALDDVNLGRGQVAAVHAYPGLVLIEKRPAPRNAIAR